MAMPERRPLAPMESLAGRTVRLAPSMWERVDQQARLRGYSEYLVFTRKLIEYALQDAERETQMEESVGHRRQVLSGSRRPRRF